MTFKKLDEFDCEDNDVLLHLPELLERTWKRVQVSMAPAQTNIGEPAMVWNLTAPCVLEAELWLCWMERRGLGQNCREVEGSRQQVEKGKRGGWQRVLQGHWVQI